METIIDFCVNSTRVLLAVLMLVGSFSVLIFFVFYIFDIVVDFFRR